MSNDPSRYDEEATSSDDSSSTTTTRIDRDLLRMARIICAHTPGRGGSNLKVTDYLDSILRGPITQRHEEILAEIARQQETRKQPRKKS